jgi:RimJ/RimL family protein N-acetyltransferase
VRSYTASGPLVFPDEGADEAGGADGRTLCWIVEVDGVPGGLASLVEIDRLQARAALAHCLAEPELECFGVNALVEYWLMEYAIEGMGLERVTCEAAADDVTARRMHEAFGFTEEARSRGRRESGDRRIDVIGLGLLAADWRASRPAVARRLRLRGFDPPQIR